jgi:hypothetical protein
MNLILFQAVVWARTRKIVNERFVLFLLPFVRSQAPCEGRKKTVVIREKVVKDKDTKEGVELIAEVATAGPAS